MEKLNRSRLKLVYVKPILTDGKDYEYDFIFSETPEAVWGPDWDDNAPNICGDISPEPTTYDLVKRVKSALPFKTIQENSCFSMEYAINRSVALAWVDIEGLEEYPENGRMVFHFDDTYLEVEAQLELHNIFW